MNKSHNCGCELYGGPLPGYDIGLVKVQREFEFNEKVQPIKYSTKKVPAGTQLQTFECGGMRPSECKFREILFILMRGPE